jgi:hypothetical protein
MESEKYGFYRAAASRIAFIIPNVAYKFIDGGRFFDVSPSTMLNVTTRKHRYPFAKM